MPCNRGRTIIALRCTFTADWEYGQRVWCVVTLHLNVASALSNARLREITFKFNLFSLRFDFSFRYYFEFNESTGCWKIAFLIGTMSRAEHKERKFVFVGHTARTKRMHKRHKHSPHFILSTPIVVVTFAKSIIRIDGSTANNNHWQSDSDKRTQDINETNIVVVFVVVCCILAAARYLFIFGFVLICSQNAWAWQSAREGERERGR